MMRARNMQRDNDITTTTQHIRHNSSIREGVQCSFAPSCANVDSQSVSLLRESSPRRNMGPLLDSAAWRGSWTDRSILSDRAVMTSLSRAQADIERNRNHSVFFSAAHIPSSNTLHPHAHTHTDSEILDLKDSNARVIPVGGRTVDFLNSEVRRTAVPTLYFRSQVTSFGMTAIGTNSRQKVELCNASSEEVCSLTAFAVCNVMS